MLTIQLSNRVKRIHRNLQKKSPTPFPPSGHKIPLRPMFLSPCALMPLCPSCLRGRPLTITLRRASSTENRASSIKNRVSSIQHPASRIKISLDTQLCTMYNIHLTNRGFLIRRTKLQLKRPSRRGRIQQLCTLHFNLCILNLSILPRIHRHRASILINGLFLCVLSLLCGYFLRAFVSLWPRVNSAKQSQFQNGQNDHKYSNNKRLCQ